MRFILRLATKAAWPGGSPDLSRAVADFSLREGERGLSVWAYESHEDRDLILAALTCTRLARGQGVDRIDFLSVPAAVVEALGPITKTPGDTPVRSANQLHCELQWSQTLLMKLAETLFEQKATVTRIGKPDVRRLLRCVPLEEVATEAVREELAHARSETGKKL